PGLPGAAWSSVRRVLCARRQASACSRAPEPTTSTFTRRVYSRCCEVSAAARRSSSSRRQRCSSGSFFLPRRTQIVRAAATITGTKIDSATTTCVQVLPLSAGTATSREHVLARGAHADELDRQLQRRRHELDVLVRRPGQLRQRRRLVERLPPARENLPHGLGVVEVRLMGRE